MRIKSLDITRRNLLAYAAKIAVLWNARTQVKAQTVFPSRTIRVVVPYAPGGGTDVIGRPLMQLMAASMGQSIIIDNKPGAGTVIGTDIVARAESDGHTLLMTTSAIAINASLMKSLPYDTLRDLVPVGQICHGPNVIVVRSDSPFYTLTDILKVARAKPAGLTYASSGNGSAVHLAAELLKLMAKVSILHIPYRGAGPAYTDLLAGQVDMLFGTAGGVHNYVTSGRMRAIAVTSLERSIAYPKIPTVSETVPNYSAEVWYGVFAPKGTSAATVNKINAAMKAAASNAAYRETLLNDGLTPLVNTPAEMSEFMRAEVERWRRVVTTAGITPD